MTTANAPNPNRPLRSNEDGKMDDASNAPIGVMSEKINNANILLIALCPDIKNKVMSTTEMGML